MSQIKVMIVDDEAGFAETLAERLMIRDIEVIIAETGKEALSMMPEQEPDVVLLDFTLPDMSGPDVLIGLKDIDPFVQVILLSGCSIDTLTKLKGAATACITKPVKLVEILDAIKAADHRRRKEMGG